MKRVISLFLTIALLLSGPVPVYGEGEDFVPVVLSMSSNLSKREQIAGYYRDQVFYADLDELCELTGLILVEEEGGRASLRDGDTEEDSLRFFTVQADTDELTEEFYRDRHTVEMPAEIIGEELYVSMFHFLTYMGTGYELDPEGDPQLTVIKWYDLPDALRDYAHSGRGNYFRWSEIDFSFGSAELNLTYQGVLAMLAEESDPFKMMFDADSIYQEDLEDDLFAVVANEGAEYIQDSDGKLAEFSHTVFSSTLDWYELITNTYKMGKDSTLNKLLKRLSKGNLLVSSGAKMAVGLADTLDFAMQCANMTDTQKNLLKETILKYGRETDMVRENDFWEIMIEAAEQVSGKVREEIPNDEEILDTFASAAYSLYKDSAGTGTLFKGNLALLTWDTVMGIFRFSSAADQAREIHNAYNCSMIQTMGGELVSDAMAELYYHDYYYDDEELQEEVMTELKYDMILQLKATLSTREALVKSGGIEGIEESYGEMCEETAALLKRVENAALNGPGGSSGFDDDLTWMADYTPSGEVLYLLALKKLEERGSFAMVREGTMSGDFSDFQDIVFTENMEVAEYGSDGMRGGGRYQHTGGTAPWETDYTYTYENQVLTKEYRMPFSGQQTEQRQLIDVTLPFWSYVKTMETKRQEDRRVVFTVTYDEERMAEDGLGLLNYLLPDNFRIYWNPASEGEDGIIRAELSAVIDENLELDSITVDYELIGGIQDVARLQGTTVFVFDDKGAEKVQEGEIRQLAGTWLQQDEANPILLVLGEDGSLFYTPSVTRENEYTSTYSLENGTLWLNMVNLDVSGVTRVPFLMESDPSDENLMIIAVDRERAPSLDLLYGMDGVLEGTYRRLRFSKAQLEEIGEMLRIPEGREITWEQGEPYYWDAGVCWLISVMAYENGEFVAGADFNGETMEMCRNIFTYSGG